MNIAELAIANGFIAPEGYNPLNGFFGCTTQHPYFFLKRGENKIEFCLDYFTENDPIKEANDWNAFYEVIDKCKQRQYKSIRVTEDKTVKYCGTEIPNWIEAWLKS